VPNVEPSELYKQALEYINSKGIIPKSMDPPEGEESVPEERPTSRLLLSQKQQNDYAVKIRASFFQDRLDEINGVKF
jgi:hypothetical protein